MVCPSEAEARWPRFGLVVVATTSRRYNKDQMIRPLVCFLTNFGDKMLLLSENIFPFVVFLKNHQQKTLLTRKIKN
jgi:hypothetical protein